MAYTFYGVALACCVFSVLVTRKNFQPTIWSNGFAVICAGSLTLGFVIRVQAVVAQIWKTVFGKLLLAQCSAFTAVVASVPARHVVSGAMHLPVGDFPATLTFWTILCYPAVAIGLATAILLVVYVLLLVIAALTVFSTHPPSIGSFEGRRTCYLLDRYHTGVSWTVGGNWQWLCSLMHSPQPYCRWLQYIH